MIIKVYTNKREFILETDDIKETKRGLKGSSLMTICKTKLIKGENLVRLEEM